MLLAYFNEIITESCGKCDVCKSKTYNSKIAQPLIDQIIKILKDQELSSQQLATILKCNEKQLLNSLKLLLEKNKIAITSQNKFKLNF